MAEAVSFHTVAMKANISRALALALPAVLVLATSCSERRIVPTPTPTATPTAVPPPPQPRSDWSEAPATPGNWVWSSIAGRSTAAFAGGMLQLRCERERGAVILSRRGSADGTVPMTVSTSAMTRTVNGAGSQQEIAVALPVRDPLLDAMAFSRGHFALDVAGLQTLYVPSWPEVSRVIEDCR